MPDDKGSNGRREAATSVGGLRARLGGLWETVQTVVYAVLIALVIRTFAYEPFNIPSGSMIPTLLVGDYLFVSKFAYGYSRYSLPWSLPLIPGRVLYEPPERGDVVVFRPPNDPDVDFIKRIVGLPGDRIQVVGGVLNINGEAVARERVGEIGGGRRSMVEYVETLPNGRRHRILEESDHAPLDDTREYRVPDGHFFAMGDNRDNSHDSRVLGFIPAANLVGRAEIIFFSTNGEAAWWEVWAWPIATRFGRLFDVIE